MTILKPSVTQIVEKIYPTDPYMFQKAIDYDGLKKKREKGQLVPGGIAEKVDILDSDKVMKMLWLFWTIIHSQAFDIWMLWLPGLNIDISQYHIKSLQDFFNNYRPKYLSGEKAVETEYYTWTLDAILEIDGKKILVDYKTYSAYKYIYWIENNILKKNWEPYSISDRLKKVSLQLSMYNYWLQQENISIDEQWLVWITEFWYFVYPVEYNLDPFWEYIKKPKLSI